MYTNDVANVMNFLKPDLSALVATTSFNKFPAAGSCAFTPDGDQEHRSDSRLVAKVLVYGVSATCWPGNTTADIA